ncbi:2-amino-4-oxopentanoate thiolase subunit OrtB [Planococcus sp. ISL-109]|uniref:2-amino-4-oxopentanoate thiolase subunit OrtB n=1 Tax=Planococcus sp. ISL-109 TaxID=2819166 RepID=UPI001BEB839B|nr:2-amino-4-oxopentanoate thiolase subunit OrtB [Planococcus sp. ISL-109]MBT2582810.1 PLP-dependent lyase/thiolase [Planococcus sp. ISL-109]
MNTNFTSIMNEKHEIMKQSLGLDYSQFEQGEIGFDYEKMMASSPYSFEEVQMIQQQQKIGDTPLVELKNFTKIIREHAEPGYGARIFVKDEACNPSGSYKDRRASLAVHHAKVNGYKGVICATSGNYGAAVASQAAMQGLHAIILQEVFDSKLIGQPEILEKSRACMSYGAEVIQLTVGPELFYTLLAQLKETGYFNASLYSPLSVAGVETLGYEIASECKEKLGRFPDAVIATNAGGGNLTGTARGLLRAGANQTKVIAASVDLKGLHMASDQAFNRKSFTTGHTGFGIPFATNPDRVDVPRNSARPLRYMDRYVLVTQGEVFYVTEALAQIEGLERGPAGNISLTAAFSLAKEMPSNQILVVQETEYTGAGKHPTAQLTFAKENGIEIKRGHPSENVPGEKIVIPRFVNEISCKDIDLNQLRKSYLKNKLKDISIDELTGDDKKYFCEETKWSIDQLEEELHVLSSNRV